MKFIIIELKLSLKKFEKGKILNVLVEIMIYRKVKVIVLIYCVIL